MIGYLKGDIKTKLLDSVLLVVNGVGYRVLIPPGEYALAKIDEERDFFIHTHVKEDAFDLYGFQSEEELWFFEMLIGVSGIGPKTALLVIDKGVEPVKAAIMKADLAFFTLIPRLGTKNAQKIIIELKNKLGSLADLDLAGESTDSIEVVEALVAMGYNKKEAIEKVKKVPESAVTVEEKIRWALRN